jgi:hypothetical protein
MSIGNRPVGHDKMGWFQTGMQVILQADYCQLWVRGKEAKIQESKPPNNRGQFMLNFKQQNILAQLQGQLCTVLA